MRRVASPLALIALVVVGLFAGMPRAAAQDSGQARVREATFETVDDWKSGASDGLIIANNAGGELRLADGRKQGSFTSGFLKLDGPVNAVGAVWKADIPQGTGLLLEVRAAPDQANPGPWAPLRAGDARTQDGDAYALPAVVPVPGNTAYVQVRATLRSDAPNASPTLDSVTLSLIDATPGPDLAAATAELIPAPFGPATLTPAPRVVARARWDPNPPAIRPARQQPRGIVLHQIGTDAAGDDPPPFLRALAAYHQQQAGWDDLPYHFLIDRAGRVYEGHIGGPSAAVPRLAGGDIAVHVALLGTGVPPAPQQTALAGLLAWLGQAYGIPPRGQHTLSAPGGTSTRQNIVTHAQADPAAADQAPELNDIVAALRLAADQATVASRWYFAEGNPRDYTERLSVFNPAAEPATVRFAILRSPGPEVIRTISVPAGSRAELSVSGIFTDTTDAPAIVESNAAVVAERFMGLASDITATPGAPQAARVWYFAEGSTEGTARTFLALFNPQTEAANATITYMRSDGRTAEQRGVINPPRGRTVFTVADVLPGATFGARVLADRPIVAERLMRFGPNDSGLAGSPGVVALSRTWHFAEGTTEPPFQMRLLVLNPNTQPVTATVRFMTPDGTSQTRRYALPPTSRLAINANEVVPQLGVATYVEADRPVAAERAMTWRDGAAGSVSPGATEPAFIWRFADGRTSGDAQEYLLFSNPDRDHQARVTVDFVLNDGKLASQQVSVPGGARYTMAVHELYPGQPALAATVRATVPIVVERSLYPGSPRGDTNRGGPAALGGPAPLR